MKFECGWRKISHKSKCKKMLRVHFIKTDEIRVRLAENQPQKQVQKDAESTFYKKGEFL